MRPLQLLDHPYKHSKEYQQALDQFGVTELLTTLSCFCDPDFDTAQIQLDEQERERLAALLIQQLCRSLDGQLLAETLALLRSKRTAFPRLRFKLSPNLLTLPEHFLAQTSAPRFRDGEAVRWLPLPNCSQTDSGIVIGHCFAYAPHRHQWGWQYLVWLKNAAAPTLVDAAWEEDLEPLREVVP
jgi:hypothetical protein